MKQLFILSILLFVVSCSEDTWSKEERVNFVQSCREEGGSKNYCDCFMTNVMEKYPIAEDAKEIDFEVKIELSKDCK